MADKFRKPERRPAKNTGQRALEAPSGKRGQFQGQDLARGVGEGGDGESAVIYGRKPVAELLRHAPGRIQRVMLAKSDGSTGGLQAIASDAGRRGIEAVSASPAELDNLSGFGVHQGVAALLKPAQSRSLDEIVAKGKAGRGLILALDQITDPHNFGAILRAAEAAGVDGVVVPRSGSSPITPVVRKSSAGAAELVPICFVSNLSQAITRFKKEGFWIIGTSLEPRSQSVFETDFPHPAVIVIGSEGKGIRRLTEEGCDLLVQIPMQGLIQSLNVSQAAAVVLFELLRRAVSPKAVAP